MIDETKRQRRLRSDKGKTHAKGARRPDRILKIDGIEMTLEEARAKFGYNDTPALIRAIKALKKSNNWMNRLYGHEVEY